MASGCRIGAPWIEFRDQNGSLVSRLHVRIGTENHERGFAAIDDLLCQGGLGQLLTLASASSEFRKPFIRVALNHAILAGREEQTVEDRLGHICRGIESIAERFECNKQNLLAELSRPLQDEVRSSLRTASEAIKRLTARIDPTDESLRGSLARIADRTASASNQDRSFGLAVLKLLEFFNLHDAEVVNAYYAQHPRADKRPWASVLSLYRGISAHGGYFSLQHGHNPVEGLHVALHLHDILLRLILSMYGYAGKYKPRVTRWLDAKDVGWVSPATDPRDLGYDHTKPLV